MRIPVLSFLPLILIMGAFYFFFLRPQQQKRKDQLAQVKSAGPGTDIMTTAGIFGTIRANDGEKIDVEIAPGVVIRMLPAAISTVVTKPGDDLIESGDTGTEPGNDTPNA